jgi:hypothetical protein
MLPPLMPKPLKLRIRLKSRPRPKALSRHTTAAKAGRVAPLRRKMLAIKRPLRVVGVARPHRLQKPARIAIRSKGLL